MPADFRPRRAAKAALTVALALLSGCVQNPNSVFHPRTEFNRDVGDLFSLLIWLGLAVFVFTEAMLLYAMWRFRSRPGKPRQPEQVHGNTKLEILWTVIPAVVLAVIAVPTVQTIFRTQGAARADALQVEVIGHQWWWEFRYPEHNITTANELYLPVGRTVNFHLKTHDVLHSFWIPGLGGKRDLVNNRTNYLWFTPDSTAPGGEAFNGFCAEYCGTSHANMRFKAYTVSPEEFASWVAHQQSGPSIVFPPAAPPPAPARSTRTAATGPAPAAAAPVQAGFTSFPVERMAAYTIPRTPIPASVNPDTTLTGDPARGAALVSGGTCIGCHTVKGSQFLIGKTAPDLTHVGSRNTIAGGLFPNNKLYLTAWIKNATAMKPGSLMPTLGVGQYDYKLKQNVRIGMNDQQVADIVAYLQALK
jgi:cytochrome c oxidase subunit 2